MFLSPLVPLHWNSAFAKPLTRGRSSHIFKKEHFSSIASFITGFFFKEAHVIFRSPFPPATIPDISYASFVLRQAERLAEKPALIDGLTGQQYTYGQLADAVRRVASSLAARGFGKGDVLALYSPNLPEYPIPFLAAATLGGITTTINPLYTVEELAFQLNDAHALYLVTTPAFVEKALEGKQRSQVREVFVFGEAAGATPFAVLLQGDGNVPQVEINAQEDVVALP